VDSSQASGEAAPTDRRTDRRWKWEIVGTHIPSGWCLHNVRTWALGRTTENRLLLSGTHCHEILSLIPRHTMNLSVFFYVSLCRCIVSAVGESHWCLNKIGMCQSDTVRLLLAIGLTIVVYFFRENAMHPECHLMALRRHYFFDGESGFVATPRSTHWAIFFAPGHSSKCMVCVVGVAAGRSFFALARSPQPLDLL